jgi:hypothetical protein
MKIRQTFTVAALLTSFVLASNPAKADVLGFSVALPSVGTVTAEVGKIVAADLTAYLRTAQSAPRVTHSRQSPTVTIQQIETAATTTMETITVVATRLPPLATESLAQASNTHTRL